MAIPLSQTFAAEPQNSLDVNQVNSKDLMQGNDFYGIRVFQTQVKPDSILGWFQQNLPTIKNQFGSKLSL